MTGLQNSSAWGWVDVAQLCWLAAGISGTTAALVFGKLLLAAVLGAFATGAWLRFKRGRVARGKQAS